MSYSTPALKLSQQSIGRLLLIGVLLLGLFFRVSNLDRKIYWVDEVYTSSYLAGRTYDEISQAVVTGQPVTVEALQQYQYPLTNGSMTDPIRVLALEDSQHVPLYYVTLWAWVRLWGNSINVVRSLSVLFSIVAIPCLYWLCRELFRSRRVSWMAVAVMAISPFHVLYAQEARPYSLYVLVTLLSSATLLRAIRVRTRASWFLYALTLIPGLYTHIFFSIVMAGHGIYVAVLERFRFKQPLLSYLAASLFGLLCFSPWLWVIATAPNKFPAQSWANTKPGFAATIVRWIGIISRGFLDVGIGPSDGFAKMLPLLPVIAVIFVIIGYSFWFLCRHTPIRIWLFVVTLAGGTLLVLAIPDFILGLRYATTRFLVPSVLGIQLAIAYLLAQKLQITTDQKQAKYWQAMTAFVLAVGLVSCLSSSQAQIWWNKDPEGNRYVPQAAALINQTDRPLVVSDDDLIDLSTLGHLLRPGVHFQLTRSPQVPEIAQGFSDVFLFKPSDTLLQQMKQRYPTQLEQLVEPLWTLRSR